MSACFDFAAAARRAPFDAQNMHVRIPRCFAEVQCYCRVHLTCDVTALGNLEFLVVDNKEK